MQTCSQIAQSAVETQNINCILGEIFTVVLSVLLTFVIILGFTNIINIKKTIKEEELKTGSGFDTKTTFEQFFHQRIETAVAGTFLDFLPLMRVIYDTSIAEAERTGRTVYLKPQELDNNSIGDLGIGFLEKSISVYENSSKSSESRKQFKDQLIFLQIKQEKLRSENEDRLEKENSDKAAASEKLRKQNHDFLEEQFHTAMTNKF